MSKRYIAVVSAVALALILSFVFVSAFTHEADLVSGKTAAQSEKADKQPEELKSGHTTDRNSEMEIEIEPAPFLHDNSFNNPDRAMEIPVLMYHHFDENIRTGTIADPTAFYEQMKILKEAGYTSVTTDDVIADFKGERRLPQKPVLITLDDGYESNYTYVFPILKELNMKATIFIITDFLENPDQHPSPYSKLTWDEVKEMSDSGLVSFQSHTDNRHSRRINGVENMDAEYADLFLQDLLRSKRILEAKLDKPVTAFSYPNGEYSASSEQVVKEAGFDMSLSTNCAIFDTGQHSLYLVNRINIHGDLPAESILQSIDKYKTAAYQASSVSTE